MIFLTTLNSELTEEDQTVIDGNDNIESIYLTDIPKPPITITLKTTNLNLGNMWEDNTKKQNITLHTPPGRIEDIPSNFEINIESILAELEIKGLTIDYSPKSFKPDNTIEFTYTINKIVE